MLSSIFGSVIMTIATLALLMAIGISEDNRRNMGKQSLSKQEKEIMSKAGFDTGNQKELHQDIKDFFKTK